VNIIVVIRNQGNATASGFWTDLFYDPPYPPSPPADGNDYFWTGSLAPGETRAWAFYIGNNEAETWSMYVLIDSWNQVNESNENNNVWGPEYVIWSLPAKLGLITRQAIIDTGWTFVRVNWQCPSQNAYPPSDTYCVEPNNDQTWTSDFVVGNWYTGEAYEWGGWDKPNRFLNKMANGQRAGAHMENDCLPDSSPGNPCWATGTDCSGFVSRCWQLPQRHGTKWLFDVAHAISYDSLKMGDALDDTTYRYGRHVRLFLGRLDPPNDTLYRPETWVTGVRGHR
jgi:hypothetical protein